MATHHDEDKAAVLAVLAGLVTDMWIFFHLDDSVDSESAGAQLELISGRLGGLPPAELAPLAEHIRALAVGDPILQRAEFIRAIPARLGLEADESHLFDEVGLTEEEHAETLDILADIRREREAKHRGAQGSDS